MTLFHSKYLHGGKRTPASQWAGDMVGVRFEVTVPDTAATDDVIELGILPAHHSIRDAIIDTDALDEGSSPALVLDVGLMTGQVGEELDDAGDPRVCDDELFDGVDVGQAGGVLRASLATAFTIAPVAYDRSIGVKIATEADEAAEGTFGLTVFYST